MISRSLFREYGKKLTGALMAAVLGISAAAVPSGFVIPTVYAAEDTTNKTGSSDDDTSTINGDDVVELARNYIGLAYGGGKSLQSSVDCSAFVYLIYQKFGITLFWDSTSMYNKYSKYGELVTDDGTQVELCQAGDIIISTGHVAIATGEGTAISATTNRGVYEHSLTGPYAHTYFGGAKYYGDWIIVRPYGVGAGSTYNDPLVGKLEGVDYSAVYDFDYYYAKYTNLKAALGSIDNAETNAELKLVATNWLNYFVTKGMALGQQATESFDQMVYKKNYADLKKAYGDNTAAYYTHYMKYGQKEKRNAVTLINPVTVYNGVDYSAVYDFHYYQNRYGDIKKAFGNDDEATLRHFVTYGMKEGRQAKESFNVDSYKNKYRDLRLAFGSNKVSYYQHYIKYGVNEKRTATGVTTVQNPVTSTTITINGKTITMDFSDVYDYNYYINRYGDLKKAFGNDDIAALKHFVTYGMKEGRQAKEDFNLQAYKGRYGDLRKAYGLTTDDNYKYYLHYINYGVREHRNAKAE